MFILKSSNLYLILKHDIFHVNIFVFLRFCTKGGRCHCLNSNSPFLPSGFSSMFWTSSRSKHQSDTRRRCQSPVPPTKLSSSLNNNLVQVSWYPRWQISSSFRPSNNFNNQSKVRTIIDILFLDILCPKEGMPEDSGWYWCDTDFYQLILYVDIKPVRPDLLLPSDILHPQTSVEVGGNKNHDSQFQTEGPPTPSSGVMLHQRKGTADQMKVYGTYQNKWRDRQVTKSSIVHFK